MIDKTEKYDLHDLMMVATFLMAGRGSDIEQSIKKAKELMDALDDDPTVRGHSRRQTERDKKP